MPSQPTELFVHGFGDCVVVHYYRELLNFCLRTVKDRDAAADAATIEALPHLLPVRLVRRGAVTEIVATR